MKKEEGNGVDAFLERLYENIKPKFRIEDCLCGGRNFPEWKKDLSKEVKRILAVDDDAEWKILEKVPLFPYGSVMLSYQWYSLCGLECPCYVLEPDEVKGAVIAFAGHGKGIMNIPGGENADSYMHDFPLELARRGFIVYCPELLGIGSLRLSEDIKDDRPSSCERLSSLLPASGRTLLGMRVMQGRAVMRMIERLQPGLSVSLMGISGGGTVVSFLSALEGDNLSSVVISGYAGCWEDSILRGRHCSCNYVPGMLESFTLPSLLSSVAPVPMLWETGKKDRIFRQASALEAEKTVREAYLRWGKDEDFVVDAFPGGHEIHGKKAYDFLLSHVN